MALPVPGAATRQDDIMATKTQPTTTAKPNPTSASATAKGAASDASAPPQQARPGLLSHTEFASKDPAATRRFLEKAFGWRFDTMPGPTGDYHMFRQSNDTGGGVRAAFPEEPGRTIPYVEAEDVQRTINAALKAGAKVATPRTELGPGMGAIAVLEVPGGLSVGLWGPR